MNDRIYLIGALKAAIIIALIAAIPFRAWSQTDTLGEVNVHGRRNVSKDVRINEFTPGQELQTIDTMVLQQYRQQQLTTLLTQQTPVFIKSFGMNGLATLNFRGASAAQSMVYWNGVPIQNAALGVADVSTMPISFMDRISILYGGSAALLGSGNVGGALLLENALPKFDSNGRSLSVNGGTGSFGQYSGGIDGSVSSRKWYVSGSVFLQQAQNDFSYGNLSGQNTLMQNSRVSAKGLMVQGAYEIKEGSTISLSVWSQHYDREIPPALFEANSDKRQQDGSLRMVGEWRNVQGRNLWYVKPAFTRDQIHYVDSSIVLNTSQGVSQYYQEAGWKRRMSDLGNLLVFIPVQYSWVDQVKTDTQRQYKAAIAAAWQQHSKDGKLDGTVNCRGELVDGTSVLLPGADASWQFWRWLKLRANVQRTYRVPSLNELYYFPGGNTSLRPESGWSGDGGFAATVHLGQFTLRQETSLFDRDIHNWILWIGGAIWTPHNIAEVHSRGTETGNEVSLRAGNWTFHVRLSTTYVLATTVKSDLPGDGSVGKQIPYTPRYNGRLQAGFGWKRWYVNYTQTYTGYRFITSDESAYLAPCQTGNVQAMYTVMAWKHEVRINAQCNNVWDERYQVVFDRPMPGRNWLLGIYLQLL